MERFIEARRGEQNPMSIIRNLEKVHVAVVLDTFDGSKKKLGEQLSTKAVSAIMKGMGSPEWNEYMSLFANNAKQLTRLTVQDEDEPSYFRRSRAYIVANAVCGAGTTGETGQNVEAGLGAAPAGLAQEQFDVEDGEFVKKRPFAIPDIVIP
jgi:hypothetical protein